MSEPVRRSALHGRLDACDDSGAIANGPGVYLGERRPSALLQLNGAPCEAGLAEAVGDLKPRPVPASQRASVAGELTFLWNGPGQWLVTSETLSPADVRAILTDPVRCPNASLTDLSQARTVVSLSGRNAGDIVAKGCPLDLASVVVGFTAPTLYGHFSVQIHRTAQETFEMYVLRSFGLALWEVLIEEAQEFGCALAGD